MVNEFSSHKQQPYHFSWSCHVYWGIHAMQPCKIHALASSSPPEFRRLGWHWSQSSHLTHLSAFQRCSCKPCKLTFLFPEEKTESRTTFSSSTSFFVLHFLQKPVVRSWLHSSTSLILLIDYYRSNWLRAKLRDGTLFGHSGGRTRIETLNPSWPSETKRVSVTLLIRRVWGYIIHLL